MKVALKTRYIFKEFIINFLFSFLIFLFIFFLQTFFRLIDVIIKGSFSMDYAFKFFSLNIAMSFYYIIPLTFLSSGISLFSTLQTDREITIFSFSGISYLKLFKPVLLFSIIFTFFLYYFNFFLLPSLRFERRNILARMKIKNPLSILVEKEIIKEFPGITIYIEKIYRNFNLKNISITKKQQNTTLFLKAEQGKVFYDRKNNQLVFLLENGNLLTLSFNSVTTLKFNTYKFIVSLPAAFVSNIKIVPKISELKLSELKNLKTLDSSLEIHKRYIFTITPLLFLFLGSGIGIKIKQKNKILYIGIGGLISILFFELLTIGEILARKFDFPFGIYFPVVILILTTKRLWK